MIRTFLSSGFNNSYQFLPTALATRVQPFLQTWGAGLKEGAGHPGTPLFFATVNNPIDQGANQFTKTGENDAGKRSSPIARQVGASRLPELVPDGQNQRTERETEEEHIAIGTGKCVIFIELIRLCAFEIIGKVMLCLPEQYTYSFYCDNQLNTWYIAIESEAVPSGAVSAQFLVVGVWALGYDSWIFKFSWWSINLR